MVSQGKQREHHSARDGRAGRRLGLRLAARVSSFEEFFSDELVDDYEALRFQDNPLNGVVLVAGNESELSRFGAHGLVLLRRQLDALGALRTGALAPKLDVGGLLLTRTGET